MHYDQMIWDARCTLRVGPILLARSKKNGNTEAEMFETPSVAESPAPAPCVRWRMKAASVALTQLSPRRTASERRACATTRPPRTESWTMSPVFQHLAVKAPPPLFVRRCLKQKEKSFASASLFPFLFSGFCASSPARWRSWRSFCAACPWPARSGSACARGCASGT